MKNKHILFLLFFMSVCLVAPSGWAFSSSVEEEEIPVVKEVEKPAVPEKSLKDLRLVSMSNVEGEAVDIESVTGKKPTLVVITKYNPGVIDTAGLIFVIAIFKENNPDFNVAMVEAVMRGDKGERVEFSPRGIIYYKAINKIYGGKAYMLEDQDGYEILSKTGIASIPHLFLIDGKGDIVGEIPLIDGMDSDQLSSFVKKNFPDKVK